MSRAEQLSLRGLVLAATGGLALLLLVAVGQPLLTDDLWWHLALGEIYATQGLSLEADPFLFTATGPPASAAWLADLILHALESALGFQGLRIAHVVFVTLLLVLVFGCGRRASGGSTSAAALAVGVFVALGAYRLIQLRPHLFTLLGALLVYRLVIEPPLPSLRQVAATVVVFAAWVNLHAGFLLGPLLLGAGTAGVAAQLGWERGARPETRRRLLRMGAAWGLATLATLANPQGVGPHRLYFAAGGETPELASVSDEWAPVALLSWPPENLPPSWLSWVVVWGLLLGVLLAAGWAAVGWLREGCASSQAEPGCDPPRVALALAATLGMLLAVRFLWLGVFPLLLILAVAKRDARLGRMRLRVAAAGACALLPGLMWLGDWKMISRVLTWESYAGPYPAAKWNGHAVWWLADAGLSGRVFATYPFGNFLGYWLSPDVRVYVNGSLNLPVSAMQDYGALLRRAAGAGKASFLETLDRYRIDLFFGTGLPRLPPANGPPEYTAAHLQHAPGWIPVFRNLRNAIHLRDDPRNRENLSRVAAYYAERGVPFDPRAGFDPIAAIEAAPGWSLAHGLMPRDLAAARATARRAGPHQRRTALARLASVYAVLGDCERASELDRQNLAIEPNVQAARRLVWCQLQLRRLEAAASDAGALEALAAPHDQVSALLVRAARAASAAEPEAADGLIARLPLLTDAQAVQILRGSEEAAPRPPSARRRAQPAARSETLRVSTSRSTTTTY